MPKYVRAKIGDVTAGISAAIGEAFTQLIQTDDKIVAVGADSLPWNIPAAAVKYLKEKAPERYFDVGITEDHFVTAAGGVAYEGFNVFCFDMGWLYFRGWNQIRQSIATDRFNIKMFGSAGWSAGGGVSHEVFEDFALMRVIPNMMVCAPADSVEAKKMTFEAAKYIGPLWCRTPGRAVTPVIFEEDYPFQLGVAATVRDGKDATIIGAQDWVYKSIMAAETLAKEGIDAKVIDMSTIKPLDKKAVLQSAKETGAIVTAETASIIGGLGEAVASTLVENYPIPMKRIGIRDRFGQSTRNEAVMDADYNLTVADLVSAVKDTVNRKK
ncbi:MAG: transketolase [Thermoproteota archaeon]|nr:transketolase [Thermoproteota archaeon]